MFIYASLLHVPLATSLEDSDACFLPLHFCFLVTCHGALSDNRMKIFWKISNSDEKKFFGAPPALPRKFSPSSARMDEAGSTRSCQRLLPVSWAGLLMATTGPTKDNKWIGLETMMWHQSAMGLVGRFGTFPLLSNSVRASLGQGR